MTRGELSSAEERWIVVPEVEGSNPSAHLEEDAGECWREYMVMWRVRIPYPGKLGFSLVNILSPASRRRTHVGQIL
jgi:hypothetical protein